MDNARLGLCEVCGRNDAKYTCPKCEVKTCSLPCVGLHKKELECDGIRDRTKYIPLNKFTNLDLQSDFRLLQDCSRHLASWKRDIRKQFTCYQKELPHYLYKLKAAAHQRKIFLKFLVQHFVRHKKNTTYLDFKTQIIYWRVEWIFSNAENLKFVDDKCNENDKLSKLINKFFDVTTDSFYKKDALVFYQSAGINGIKLLLKAEQVEECGKIFYELDTDLSLKDNLAGKTIIEYPTVLVVLNHHVDIYKIIDSDDEAKAKQTYEDQHGENNSGQSQPTDGGIKRIATKSLLFTTEYSDLEISSSDSEDGEVKEKKKSTT